MPAEAKSWVLCDEVSESEENVLVILFQISSKSFMLAPVRRIMPADEFGKKAPGLYECRCVHYIAAP